MHQRSRFLALSLVACVLWLSCGWQEDRKIAEGAAQRYFAMVQDGETDAVLSLYTDLFFRATPQDEWMNTLRQVRETCGVLRSYKIKEWSSQRYGGSDDRRDVTLKYEVQYSKLVAEEVIVVRIEGGASKALILAHDIRGLEAADAVPPS